MEKVREFAEKAHDGQKRKYTGEKFIRHPERVKDIVSEYTSDRALLAAALLHDVLEDTDVTGEELKAFLYSVMDGELAERTYQLVVDLTDVYTKADYPNLNRLKRKRKDAERLKMARPNAQTVKYADAIDNALDIVKNDRDFARVFLNECSYLVSMMDKGHPRLRQRAEKVISECLDKLRNAER